ncbi:hypothetical protein GCM10010191_49890 [Actinomadura vinacea]|uniref:Uncharacterized protein n=1 Tax=Actinomadura vinacea TaxID=115336 RepID=A0ABN3JH67_9ACTN
MALVVGDPSGTPLPTSGAGMGDEIWSYLIDASRSGEPPPGQRIAFGEGEDRSVPTYEDGHGS